MRTVAVAGASGVVGSRALRHLLAREDVGQVIAIGRRALPGQHEKLVSRVVDLQDAAAIARELPERLDVALCCLGTTMRKAGSREAFRAVDHDAVVAFGEAVLRKGGRRFVLVSALGADPRSRSFYLRTKGEVEQALERLGYAQLTVVRPSLIDDEGARPELRPAEKVGLLVARVVFSLVGKTSRYAPISADALARAAVRLAFDDTAARVRKVEGPELLRAPA